MAKQPPRTPRQDWPRERASERRSGGGPQKRGELLAAQIEADIIALGWPVGHLFGSEAELLETYGVSRAILREAIRLLEHHLVAEMRRGRNGGLFISEPDPAVVSDAVALFLRYRDVSTRDLFDVRQALEVTAARLAAQRATPEALSRLRELAEHPADTTPEELAAQSDAFHDALAEMTGNPAVHLFMQVVIMLTDAVVDHSVDPSVVRGVNRAHLGLVEALEKGDAALAQRRMSRHFEAMTEVGFPE